MKLAFFGTSDFALPSLEAFLKSTHKVLCVVTQPDRKRGRGLELSSSPIKTLALQHNLEILQPQDLGNPDFLKTLRSLGPELTVVVAYGKILSKEVLELPKVYSINLHPSLLPKYRGPAPINWAIIRGEKVTGVTVFRIDEHMDSGPMLAQVKADIKDEDTASTLADKLAKVGATTLVDTVGLIEKGKATLTQQDGSQATLAPLLKKEDGHIDWAKSSLEIHNFVRGMNPWPSAFTHLGKALLKVWQTELLAQESKEPPGTITEIKGEKGFSVATGDSHILITELQLEGKKRMPASQFLLGHSVQVGERLI